MKQHRFILFMLALTVSDAFAFNTGNLISNGDFEQWADGKPVNWTTASAAGNATLKQSTTAHGGSYSVQVGGSASGNKRLGYKEMSLAAGTYTVKFYAKALAAGGTLRPGIVPVSSDNKAGTYAYSDYVDNISTGDWQLVEASLDVPTAATLTRLRFPRAWVARSGRVSSISIPS